MAKLEELKPPSSNSDSSSSAELIENCFGYLKLYSDGTIFRSAEIKHKSTIQENPSVIWNDFLFDPLHNLNLRIYKPKKDPKSPNHKQLPILFYFHAGGFCFGERFYPNPHNSSLSLCSGLQSVVISPDYRLAPENRLPAAIEDGFTAIKWLRDSDSQTLTWLSDVEIDFDRVFVFGDSSGGNIAHHLAVRLGRGSPELKPIRVRGYILLSPFFGGVLRTKREEEKPYENFWSQEIYDQ
ncbi:hypothetical protein M9H77_00923 [Catharanthus roseus]|uniref:Uncharacterized protein n=1 Tax=Catharanthus roseus TaxID=4058 RepID=A0ACC0C435_CATRO|nr:hypothetical protein M9H77_00923 [Catharanthus roseus]